MSFQPKQLLFKKQNNLEQLFLSIPQLLKLDFPLEIYWIKTFRCWGPKIFFLPKFILEGSWCEKFQWGRECALFLGLLHFYKQVFESFDKGVLFYTPYLPNPVCNRFHPSNLNKLIYFNKD